MLLKTVQNIRQLSYDGFYLFVLYNKRIYLERQLKSPSPVFLLHFNAAAQLCSMQC